MLLSRAEMTYDFAGARLDPVADKRFAVAQLSRAMARFLPRTHPVLQHVPGFLAAVNKCNEVRLMRMGLLQVPLAETTLTQKLEQSRAPTRGR